MTAPLKLKRQSVKSKPGKDKEDLAKLKVASVLVDTPVSHLEGLYDYLIPSSLTSIATIGTKVIVEFGKKNTEGLIVGISDIVSLSPNVPFVKAFTPSALRTLFVLFGGTPCVTYEGNIIKY